MVRRPPWLTRRLLVMLVVALVVVLAGGATAATVRAGQAQDARAAAADAAAADADREAAELAAEQADSEARALAQAQADAAELASRWATVSADAQAQLTGADAVLAASAGQVADDGLRFALAQTMDAVRGQLEAAGDREPDALTGAVAAMLAASATVTEAQSAWQADQDARAAQEAAEAAAQPALGGPPSTGAGPDCGGPGSYEPPKDDGSPVFYTSTPSQSGDGSNGRIPASQMSPLGWCQDSQGNQQWLRADAADALTRLNEAFRTEFGENIAVDLSYRSYDDQVQMRDYYGSLAAQPGTSNHGTGLAIDTWEWQAYAFGSARYDWLVANAPSYGWTAPDWAREGGSNPEYWHFEYVG